jgi:hypothetical protein
MRKRALVSVLAPTGHKRVAHISFPTHHDTTADHSPADGIETTLLLFLDGGQWFRWKIVRRLRTDRGYIGGIVVTRLICSCVLVVDKRTL